MPVCQPLLNVCNAFIFVNWETSCKIWAKVIAAPRGCLVQGQLGLSAARRAGLSEVCFHLEEVKCITDFSIREACAPRAWSVYVCTAFLGTRVVVVL